MLEIVATSLSLIGAFLVAYRVREGFLIWLVANTLWVIFALQNAHKGMAVLFAVYFITSFIGYRRRK